MIAIPVERSLNGLGREHPREEKYQQQAKAGDGQGAADDGSGGP
jgi:hypothetical protein